MKKALVTGACGQDGLFLTRYLKSLGYEVWAGVRHDCQHLIDSNIKAVYLNSIDFASIQTAIHKSNPDEIYNLAAQSFVPPSWSRADNTLNINAGGLSRIIEVVEKFNPKIKIYQASSSEMYGNSDKEWLDEKTEMIPTSPYGVSKLAAHRLCSVYRAKGLFICGGICFNHESEYRGEEMVTRKITKHVAKWVLGSKEPLLLGSTDAQRDWGYAGDYVKAMHRMMQLSKPDDFVIATGETYSVQDFLDEACEVGGISNPLVEVDERFIRVGEIRKYRGNTHKAKSTFGFTPTTNFRSLVKLMVESDIRSLKHG